MKAALRRYKYCRNKIKELRNATKCGDYDVSVNDKLQKQNKGIKECNIGFRITIGES